MSSLVNLALLESLKAHDVNDEIDLYIPFLANTILEIEKIPFDIRDVAQAFKDKFGFKPPEAVVKVLLVRAKKRGLVKSSLQIREVIARRPEPTPKPKNNPNRRVRTKMIFRSC